MIKKPTRKKKDPRSSLIDSALTLAAERGWRRLTMAEIASQAGVELDAASRLFSSKSAIVNGLISLLDDAASEMMAGVENADDSPRDILFDFLMHRFDAGALYKLGLAALFRDLPRNPIAGLCHLHRLRRPITTILAAASIPSHGCAGQVRVKTLMIIYANAVRVWFNDDNPDIEKTMATLDNGLAQAEKLATLFWPMRVPKAPPATA